MVRTLLEGPRSRTAEKATVVDVLRDVLPEVEAFVQSKLDRVMEVSALSVPNGNGDIVTLAPVASVA